MNIKELISTRKALATAAYNAYDSDAYPGSKAWYASNDADKALKAFDSAHPEIFAAIRNGSEQELIDAEAATLAPKIEPVAPAAIAKPSVVVETLALPSDDCGCGKRHYGDCESYRHFCNGGAAQEQEQETAELPVVDAEEINATLQECFEAGSYTVHGLRVVYTAREVGAKLGPSRVWHDNEVTEDVLPGTSAVIVLRREVQSALREMKKYPGNYLLLLGAFDDFGAGEDRDEVILKDPVVLACYRLEAPHAEKE